MLPAHCLSVAPGAVYALPVCCLASPASACALPLYCLARPCAACALPCTAPRTPMHCLACARASPCARSCITLGMLVRYLCPIVGNLHVVEPMPLFPLHVFAWPCPQGLGGVRPWHGHGPPFSLRTCSPLKEHFRPFSEFLEETSKWLRRYNRIFT